MSNNYEEMQDDYKETQNNYKDMQNDHKHTKNNHKDMQFVVILGLLHVSVQGPVLIMSVAVGCLKLQIAANYLYYLILQYSFII